MEKKTLIISGIMFILLFGTVSAGLVPYLSNMVTGTVDIKGPVFYLDGYWEGAYYNLFINEIPEDEKEVYLYDGNRILFISEPLGIEDFYKVKFDIHIWAKTNESGNLMQFQIVKLKPSLEETIICVPSTINITSSFEQFEERTTSCSSPDTISLNPEDRIGVVISGADIDSEYWIMTGKEVDNDYSRVEVSKA